MKPKPLSRTKKEQDVAADLRVSSLPSVCRKHGLTECQVFDIAQKSFGSNFVNGSIWTSTSEQYLIKQFNRTMIPFFGVCEHLNRSPFGIRNKLRNMRKEKKKVNRKTEPNNKNINDAIFEDFYYWMVHKGVEAYRKDLRFRLDNCLVSKKLKENV